MVCFVLDLDAEGKRGDVNQLHGRSGLLGRKHACSDSRPHSHGLIRVQSVVQGHPVEVFCEHLPDLGDPSGATNQNYVGDLTFEDVGIGEDLLQWRDASLEQRFA